MCLNCEDTDKISFILKYAFLCSVRASAILNFPYTCIADEKRRNVPAGVVVVVVGIVVVDVVVAKIAHREKLVSSVS